MSRCSQRLFVEVLSLQHSSVVKVHLLELGENKHFFKAKMKNKI